MQLSESAGQEKATMKRILLYAALMAAVLIVPVERADVGKLRPIETVSVCKEDGWIVLRTDTEDVGIGATAASALQNMKDTASGIIYLDTAAYLLIEEDAQDAAEELREMLKDKVKLCVASKEIEPLDATRYLSAHDDLPQMRTWKSGQELPVLTQYGDRLKILKKDEKSA